MTTRNREVEKRIREIMEGEERARKERRKERTGTVIKRQNAEGNESEMSFNSLSNI